MLMEIAGCKIDIPVCIFNEFIRINNAVPGLYKNAAGVPAADYTGLSDLYDVLFLFSISANQNIDILVKGIHVNTAFTSEFDCKFISRSEGFSKV